MFTWYISGQRAPHELVTPISTAIQRAAPAHAVSPVWDRPKGGGGNPQQRYAEQEPEPRKPATRLEQIMTAPVKVLTDTDLLADAERLFDERKLRHVPILSSNGELVGIVSQRDLFRALLKTKSYAERPIAEFMNKKVLTATPDDEVRQAARIMFEERVGSLPILEDGKLVGIVTRSDVMRTVMNMVPLELWV